MNDAFLMWLEEEEKHVQSPEYKLESATLELTEEIAVRMSELEINRVELARRLDVSKPMVTKILNGNVNFTLKSIVNIAAALDCDLSIALAPCGYVTRHFLVSQGKVETSKQAYECTELLPARKRFSVTVPTTEEATISSAAYTGRDMMECDVKADDEAVA